MRVINIGSVVCIVYFQINHVINTQNCSSINGTNICCSGYQWNNERKKCIQCEKGKHGATCEKRCVFPFYGVDCQSHCKCAETYCHYAEGCSQTSEIGQISSHTTSTYVQNTAEGSDEMKNKKDKPSCPNTHKTASTDQTSMVVGIKVLAAVAFIIFLTILFTYQIEKRQRLRKCREGNL